MKIRAFERCFVNLSRDCRCLCKQRTVCLGSNFSTLTMLANHMTYQPSSDPEQEGPPILQHLSSPPRPRGCRCLCLSSQRALVTLCPRQTDWALLLEGRGMGSTNRVRIGVENPSHIGTEGLPNDKGTIG